MEPEATFVNRPASQEPTCQSPHRAVRAEERSRTERSYHTNLAEHSTVRLILRSRRGFLLFEFLLFEFLLKQLQLTLNLARMRIASNGLTLPRNG